MPSIYDLIDLDDEPAPPPSAPTKLDRGPMPVQLTHVGCGGHQFMRSVDGSYWCGRCPTVVRPGQLLHAALREWMGDHVR